MELFVNLCAVLIVKDSTVDTQTDKFMVLLSKLTESCKDPLQVGVTLKWTDNSFDFQVEQSPHLIRNKLALVNSPR